MDISLPTKTNSYHRLIRISGAYYRANFIRVLPFSILLAITAFSPSLLWDLFGVSLFTEFNFFNLNNLWLIVINLLCLVFYISILWRIHCYMIHKKEPLIEDLLIGIRKFPLVFFANIIEIAIIIFSILLIMSFQFTVTKFIVLLPQNFLTSFIMVTFFLLEFLLIVYIFSLFVFLPPLIATENKGIFSAIKRSILLVWNHWWRVISVQLTPWIAYLLTLVLLKDIFQINLHISLRDYQTHTLSSVVVQVIIFAFFIPWFAALQLVQMNDLEIRNHLLATKKAEIIKQKLPG